MSCGGSWGHARHPRSVLFITYPLSRLTCISVSATHSQSGTFHVGRASSMYNLTWPVQHGF